MSDPTREFVERLRQFCIDELGGECPPPTESRNAANTDRAWTIDPIIDEMSFNVEVFGPSGEPIGTDQCGCDVEPDAPYPACPHDLRGLAGTPGPAGRPALVGPPG